MFSGPRLSLNRAFDTTAVTFTVIKAKPADYLQTAWIKSDTNSAGSAGSSRLAFLQSADTATLTTTGQVGHVFGKLGQGTAALPDATNKGFAWAKSEAANTPTILVNLIPSVAASTLADKKTITVNAAPLGWHAATDFDLPAVPGKAADPDNLGAKALAATLVAAAAVGSTLF